MPIEPLIDSIISLIKKNVIAKTAITSDVIIGTTNIVVENSFHFRANDEIVLIDDGYNTEGSPHYQIYEYAKIKWVNNTRSISLYTPVLSNWLTANNSFVQKTIGHSPLYDDNVLFGDREVIPTDQMAVTVDPVSMSNDWMYIQGGLNEEYKLKVMIYGKDVKTEEGSRILIKYADNIVQLLNENIHMGNIAYSTPLLSDVALGDTVVIIADTPENRDKFTVSNIIPPMLKDLKSVYQLQDNRSVTYWFPITDANIGGGLIRLTLGLPSTAAYLLSEYAVIKRFLYYIWDSRAESATYGVVGKGSAVLRAAEIGWFGKMINEFSFPQPALNLRGFDEIIPNDSSSSSSSSLDSSSSSSGSSSSSSSLDSSSSSSSSLDSSSSSSRSSGSSSSSSHTSISKVPVKVVTNTDGNPDLTKGIPANFLTDGIYNGASSWKYIQSTPPFNTYYIAWSMPVAPIGTPFWHVGFNKDASIDISGGTYFWKAGGTSDVDIPGLYTASGSSWTGHVIITSP